MTKANKKVSPLGDRFRKAHTEAEQESARRQEAEKQERFDGQVQALSDWFNKVAADLPAKVGTLVDDMEAGKRVNPEFSYYVSDGGGYKMDRVEDIDIGGLPGFKALDRAAKELNISGRVNVEVEPINSESMSLDHAVRVSFDAKEPYNGVAVHGRQYRYD